MKIVEIEKRHWDFFASLDPFGYLEEDLLSGQVPIGAAVPDKASKDFDVPAGLMLLRRYKLDFYVDWIFVDPEFRLQGIGKALMNLAFEAARKAGRKKLFMVIRVEENRSLVCPYEEDFLEEYGAVWKKGLPDGTDRPAGVYEVSIEGKGADFKGVVGSVPFILSSVPAGQGFVLD